MFNAISFLFCFNYLVNAVESKNLSKFGHIMDGMKVIMCHLKSWRIDHVKTQEGRKFSPSYFS